MSKIILWRKGNHSLVGGIVFENTKVYGCGIDGQQVDNYGMHPGALMKFIHALASPVIFQGLEYANIAYTENGGIYAFAGGTSNYTITDAKNLGNNYAFSLPKCGEVARYIVQ